MKFLRWVLGALVLAYAGLSGLIAVMTAAYKLGKLKTVPADVQRMIPLWEATPWWQLAVWGVVVLLLLAAALRLFRGGRAFGVFALAVIAEAGLWWVMHKLPAYNAAFTPAELKMDPYILGGLVVGTLLIWVTERDR